MSILGVIQAIVREELRRLRVGDLGVVTSIFPHAAADDRDNYECSVALKNSGLELRKVPVATPVLGETAIPNVGDLVLVTFVGGDVHQPVIVGRLYNDEQRPPVSAAGEIRRHLPLGADEEQALKIVVRSGGDHDPKRQVEVLMGSKLTARLTDGDPLVVVDTGSAAITVADNGDVRIESGGKLAIHGSGSLDITSDGGIAIEAGGALKLSGASIDLN